MIKESKLDQFFTKPEIAKDCINLLYKTVSVSDETLFVEPSAGEGSFSLQIKNCISVDIDPKFEGVIKADFLKLKKEDITEKDRKSLIIIGNPPFGRISSLAVKFFNHATLFADTIAFIVPKTFQKQSIKRRLNPYYHLIAEQNIPKKSFTFCGQEHNVPCVFQIWQRKDQKRDLSFKYESPYFSFVKKENADFALRRVGGKTGTIIWDYNSVSPSSHYYIKANSISAESLARHINSIDFSKYINSTVGVRSLSKYEIFLEFDNYVKTNVVD
jgi:predicted RNA methylase